MPRLNRLVLCCTLAALLFVVGVEAKPPVKKPAAKAPVKTQKVPTPAPAAATAPPPDPNVLTLETVSGMAAAGAPRIALGLMDRHQPSFGGDPVGWMSWERERVYIYQGSRDWQAVIGRADRMPKAASPDFRAWEEMQAADAWLHLGDGARARAILQPLVWNSDSPPDAKTLSDLRRLLIRSDIADHKLDDAQTAVIRYRQDYPKDAGDWPLLEARLFLRLGQPDAALDVLQSVNGPEAGLVALLASLRSGEISPGDAMGQAVRLGSDSKAPLELRVHAWIVAAEAADDLKNPVARISALQNGLGLESVLPDDDDIFTLTPDVLWDAYVTYGEDLGNQLQLVVGDDQAWFVAASNRFDKDPVGACALFSVVANDAQDPQQEQVAHWQFATLMQKQKNGSVLLRRLYLGSSHFKGVTDIPANVRYLLVDDVLEIPDIPLASQLMQGLDAPPPGTHPADWQLKRAHVFILGGDPAAGVAALHRLMDHADSAPAAATTPQAVQDQSVGGDVQGRTSVAGGRMPGATAAKDAPVDADEVLQVLFDLQTLHRDKDAIPFFEALLAGPLAPEQRRQMLYWTADSYKALADYDRAAELYLRSAMLPGPFVMDPWAQTARYQAAQMLAKGGYIDDARKLYKGLLNATRDPSQQAVLEHDLQQLMLMPNKPGGGQH